MYILLQILFAFLYSIYDIAFNPDGSHLVVAAGNCIQVFDAKDGTMINKLNAHKNIVHGLTYSRDGAFFASGSADKTVIIWTRELEGQLKYSHADGIQCLAYNPVSHQILSCATSDIGLWSPEHRNVAKRKVSCRVCSCSWTNDGQYFALGLFNGLVSIWTKNGDEKIKIERPGNHPVWCLAWNPSRDDQYDILSVCDWGQRLSFYQLSGKQIGKDHSLDFDPCFFTYSVDGDFFFIGGSNKSTCLFSKEGIKLGLLGETQNSWIWSCQCRPGGKEVVISCDDGTIACYSVTLVTVHGLYKDRYAYRHGLTDVVVQHLLSEEKVHLKCRDMVKKIAVYKNRLAVQLPDKLIVYELSTNAKSGDMTYFVKEKISRSLQCSLLVCCSEHIVFCSDKKLLSLTMTGEIEREWVVDSQIRYLKVLGGASGNEAMLAGLRNGLILKFFLNNPFPVEVYRIPGVVRCVDINLNHSKLAVVDENNLLVVYDLMKKVLIYQEPNATSVAWNTSFNDMLCYSGNGILYVKAGNFLPHQQQLQTGQGFVVGFIGSKIFSLHYFNMTTTEVSQSAPMKQYLEQRMYYDAYKVACLGVSQNDWQTLALEALEGMNFEIAKKSFARVHNIQFLELIRQMEIKHKDSQGEEGMDSFFGDILANEGKFLDAAKVYCKSNLNNKAVEMYTDLCQFELAKQFMNEPDKMEQKSVVVRELKVKEADWARTKNDPSKACDMYLSAGEYMKAVTLMADNSWTQKLLEFGTSVSKIHKEPLSLCAYHLKRLGEYNFAADIYEKLEDYFSLVALYTETHQWEKGFDLVEGKPEIKDLLYLPYTTYLMENDRFEEAQEALSKAEKQNEAVSLLAQLTSSALSMKRFKDASYYHWLQAKAYLKEAKQLSEGSEAMKESIYMFHWHIKNSEIYYVYQHIHSFINLPFTGQLPETMFHMACFLANHLTNNTPPKVSKVYTYLTLGKHGTTIGANKTARYAYDKLQNFLVQSDFQDFIDIAQMTLKGKSLQDTEDALRFCYRCSTSNPPINPDGDFCVTCSQPFLYSFASFEVLPLVEFFLEDSISDEEALELIAAEPPTEDSENILKLNDAKNDLFVQRLMMIDDNGDYPTVTVDRETLASMHRTAVIVKKWPFPLKYQYYCSQVPNVPIRLCSSCNQMFYSEDYELHVLCNGQCPFCRQKTF